MKDIPVFATDNGVASLILKEIPINGRAYVKLLSSAAPVELLGECIDFCRACGADEIIGSGEGVPSGYPCVATLVLMHAFEVESTDASLFPVTEETVAKWREIYNDRMNDVPNASYMTKTDEKKLLSDGDCYFVHRTGELLGIGKASGDTIEAVASVQKGSGKDIVLALSSLLSEGPIKLIVAKENVPAMKLYDRLGFVTVSEVSKWYRVF